MTRIGNRRVWLVMHFGDQVWKVVEGFRAAGFTTLIRSADWPVPRIVGPEFIFDRHVPAKVAADDWTWRDAPDQWLRIGPHLRMNYYRMQRSPMGPGLEEECRRFDSNN